MTSVLCHTHLRHTSILLIYLYSKLYQTNGKVSSRFTCFSKAIFCLVCGNFTSAKSDRVITRLGSVSSDCLFQQYLLINQRKKAYRDGIKRRESEAHDTIPPLSPGVIKFEPDHLRKTVRLQHLPIFALIIK